MALRQDVLYKKEGNIAIGTFNRPERLNAMNADLIAGLMAVLDEARKDADIRVLIITGAGRAFCSGGDVKGMVAGVEARAKEDLPVWQMFQPQNQYLAMANYEKPILAAVNGPATGAGMSFALGADIRIASEKALFGAFWVRRGLDPGPGAPYLLPRIVGLSNALEMMYTGKAVDAQEALRIGLVSKVVPADMLMPTTMELAKHIAEMAPISVQMARRQTYRSLDLDMVAAMEMQATMRLITLRTKDHEEGATAFLEKRPPVYTGR